MHLIAAARSMGFAGLRAAPAIAGREPCNVVVRVDPADDTRGIVEAMNPQILVEVTGEPELRGVADEVTAKVQAAIDSLNGHLNSPALGRSDL
jgi:uncharacterized protein (DUF302 family)